MVILAEIALYMRWYCCNQLAGSEIEPQVLIVMSPETGWVIEPDRLSDEAVQNLPHAHGIGGDTVIGFDGASVCGIDLQIQAGVITRVIGDGVEHFSPIDIGRRCPFTGVVKFTGTMRDRSHGSCQRSLRINWKLRRFSCDIVVHESCSQLVAV